MQQTHFECSVSSPANLRTLAASFQALARHGKDVVIEGCATSLALRCINDGKSAFAQYLFNAAFFEALVCHEFFLSPEGHAAKVSLKTCLNVFRTLRQIERLVLSLVTIGAEHLLVFSAHCKHGVVKTHRCHFEQVLVLEAEFDADAAAHRVRVQPSLLVDAMQHIHGTDQITLECVSGLEMRVASHHPPSVASGSKSTLRTHMKVPAQDLDEFTVTEPVVSLTFSLNELASVLAFCGAPGVSVDHLCLYLNGPGQPLLLTSWSVLRAQHGAEQGDKVPDLFAVKLVVATLPAATATQQPSPSAPPASQHRDQEMELGGEAEFLTVPPTQAEDRDEGAKRMREEEAF